jgi:hypothetical protein
MLLDEEARGLLQIRHFQVADARSIFLGTRPSVEGAIPDIEARNQLMDGRGSDLSHIFRQQTAKNPY